jgi:signal transduction histidine kinase
VLLLVVYEALKLPAGGSTWQIVLLDALVILGGGLALARFCWGVIAGLDTRSTRQRKRMDALDRIEGAMWDSPDQGRVLQAVLEGALRLVPAGIARIAIYDTEERAFVAGREQSSSGDSRPLDDPSRPGGLSAHVVHTGEPMVFEDVAVDPSPVSSEFFGQDVAAAACVPLSHGARVLGALSVGFAGPYAITGEELGDLGLLARRAALALENARLFENVRREREMAGTLLDAADTFGATLRLDQLLERILDELQQVMPCDAASINLLSDDDCWPVASRGRGHVPARRFTLAEMPHVRRVVSGRAPVIVADVRREPGTAPIDVTDQTRAWLGVPLISKNRVIGALLVDSYRPGAYGEEEARLALAFARQAALAIDNSRLYEQTRGQLRETTLLHDVMTALASTLDVEQLLPYVAHSLCELLKGDVVEICTVEANLETATVVAEYARPDAKIPHRPPRIGQGFDLRDSPAAEEAMARRAPVQVWLNDGDLNPRERTRLEAEGARGVLILPMVARGGALGFAQVWEIYSSRSFSEREVSVGQTLIHPAAIALENTRLFEEVEAARSELLSRAEALQEANVRLQEMDELKNQFLAIMSHELRTPLSSVVGFSEILLEGVVGEMNDDQEDCLRSILVNADHILRLVNDLLDLSRIEAGQMHLDPAPFNVRVLLAEAQATIKPLTEDKAQVLTIECPDQLPLLSADRFRIKQVLLNLLSNACKFTPEKGRITVSCQSDESGVLFSVADTGIGIAPEDQSIIFEEFRQATHGRTSREITGSGLGLAVSKKLIELHGGCIWVESEPGHGATFRFTLPLGAHPPRGRRSASPLVG